MQCRPELVTSHQDLLIRSCLQPRLSLRLIAGSKLDHFDPRALIDQEGQLIVEPPP